MALITSWDDAYDEIAMVTTPVMHLYCVRNGYTFLPFKGKFHLDKERDPSLLSYGDRIKIQIYKDLYLTNEYDAIAWLDVDCLITNMEKRLEDILGDRPFLWTYGPSGPLSGFTIARCIAKTHLFLHCVQHRAAEDASPLAPGGRSDQDTMRYFMTMPPYREVAENLVSCKEAGHCFIPEMYGWEQYAWLCGWEQGDFVLTFPSIPIDDRLELLKHYRQLTYGE